MIGPMKVRRWLQIGLVLLIAAGCAQRADWIEGTLVTVDVTGWWVGRYSGGSLDGDVYMALRQIGPKATGDVRLTSSSGGH